MMSSASTDSNSGTVCSSCFNVLFIFDFCLECDINSIRCTCKHIFSSFQSFKDHVTDANTHLNEAVCGNVEVNQLKDRRLVYICSICKSLFADRKRIIIHLKSVHATHKAYTCAYCEQNYHTKLSLQRHLKIHTQQPRFTCDICKKSYFKLSLLKYHISSHLNSKHFKCNLCDKAFNDKYLLSRHIKQHSDEKLFKCDECDKLFSFNFALKRHKLTHNSSNNFVCDICKKMYKWKVDLHRHILTHTRGKSFACSVCKKKFSRKSYLMEHKVVHNDAKLHICFCGKTFKFLSGLSKHRNVHKKNIAGKK